MHTEALADALIARFDSVLDKTKLQKLMYYANAWNLAITGEALVPISFEAWANGPVLPPIWRSRQDSERRDGALIATPRLEPFTSALLDMVVTEYGHRSSSELSAMTHAEEPWLSARGTTPQGERSNAPIETRLIAAHYRSEHELCGFSASELAVLGLPHGEAPTSNGRIQVAEPTPIDDLPEDDWGGANLFVLPDRHSA